MTASSLQAESDIFERPYTVLAAVQRVKGSATSNGWTSAALRYGLDERNNMEVGSGGGRSSIQNLLHVRKSRKKKKTTLQRL